MLAMSRLSLVMAASAAAQMAPLAITARDTGWDYEPMLNRMTGTGYGLSTYGAPTDWKAKLNGQTNGKRECARRMAQMARKAG
jgi:hypothetical protein